MRIRVAVFLTQYTQQRKTSPIANVGSIGPGRVGLQEDVRNSIVTDIFSLNKRDKNVNSVEMNLFNSTYYIERVSSD